MKRWTMPFARPKVQSTRSGIIAAAAEIVLKHDTDEAVVRAVEARFSGEDFDQAEALAAALVFMKEEVGRDAVSRVLARHRALAA